MRYTLAVGMDLNSFRGSLLPQDLAIMDLADTTREAEQAARAGWMTQEQLLATGICRVEDLTELAARGILQTVAEGPTRLYRYHTR